MQLSNYRSSVEQREILRILQKSTTLEENILWQSHALRKNIVPIHHFEIDFVSREIVVFFDTRLYKIENELSLYVKLDYRMSVFKINEFRFGQNSVSFPFPTEIKTQELRSSVRHQFRQDHEKHVFIKANTTSTLSRDNASSLRVRVVDISESGLGLIVSENNRAFIKNNRILWVTHLGSEPLSYPLLGEVMYMNSEIDSKFQQRKQKDLKVGLKISGKFSKEIYDNFVKV